MASGIQDGTSRAEYIRTILRLHRLAIAEFEAADAEWGYKRSVAGDSRKPNQDRISAEIAWEKGPVSASILSRSQDAHRRAQSYGIAYLVETAVSQTA